MTAIPQVFTATSENRRGLASVAVGEENTPPETFFRGLLEPPPTVEAATKVAAVPEGEEEQVAPQPVIEIEKQEQCADITEFVADL